MRSNIIILPFESLYKTCFLPSIDTFYLVKLLRYLTSKVPWFDLDQVELSSPMPILKPEPPRPRPMLRTRNSLSVTVTLESWDGTGYELDSWQCRICISYFMFMFITWVSSGFFGYI